MSRWIVVQLGSREQYNVARALHASGKLHTMITDLWSPEESILRKLSSRSASRYHSSLSGANIVSFNMRMVIGNMFDRYTGSRFKQAYGMIADQTFSKVALAYLENNNARFKREGVTHIFAYNYYSAEIFKWAKKNGYTCVLGQIDAGPAAGKLVKKLAIQYNVDPSQFHDHYEEYLPKWQIETGSASIIVVNSEWSRKLLVEEGVDNGKIKTIPLAFESNTGKSISKKVAAFSADQPLQVLFLGSMQIQKGVIEAFEAAKLLTGSPVRFTFAGSMKMPTELLSRMPDENCQWIGFQNRSQVAQLFEQHHVLLFPTHSDGFGLVQLEAQANGLPVIASTHCGSVVTDGVNGLILENVTATEISAAITKLLNDPGLLNSLAANANVSKEFSFDNLVSKFSPLS